MYWKDPLFSVALCAIQTCGRDQKLVLGPCQRSPPAQVGKGPKEMRGLVRARTRGMCVLCVCVVCGPCAFPVSGVCHV